MFGGFDGSFIFSFLPILFGLVFVLVLAVFIVAAVQGLSQWNKNNKSPVLNVRASVVTKRTSVTHHHHAGTETGAMHHTSTTYYATFQVESGDRMELQMTGTEYGMLAEGDTGVLIFQGTRYKSFTRQ